MGERLLYIGDVPIQPNASGGSVVLWRHQQAMRNGRLDAADSSLGFRPGVGATLWVLLRRLRLGRLALILQPWLRQLDLKVATDQAAALRQQADAILTVAHGLAWLQAMAVSRATGLPLITVVHDWYPDASGCPRWGLWIWERSFRQLMRRSRLIFAVSDGMAREIGSHPNLRVLPPMPDPALQPCAPRPCHSGPWQLYYSGLCGGLYRPLLQQLVEAVASDSRFALHLSGPGHDELTLPADHPRLRSSGLLHGGVWQQAFDEADALVLVLSFERRHRRHLSTHFPSKLVEYANRGRPILIWGPPWSSAVAWGLEQPGVLTHSTPGAQQFLESVQRHLKNKTISFPPVAAFSAKAINEQFHQAVITAFPDSLASGPSQVL